MAPAIMTPYRNAERGVTLIEMMVAITVGLILLAGIIELFVSNKQAYRIQEGTNALNEGARYVLNQLTYDVRMAGHWGGASRNGGAAGNATNEGGTFSGGTAPANDCAQSPALSTLGIQGFDGGANSPLSCIAAGDYQANTDILIVRFGGAERVITAKAAAKPNTQFVRTNEYMRAEIRDGSKFSGNSYQSIVTATSVGTTDLAIETGTHTTQITATYLLDVAYYFVRRCASQSNGTAGVCDNGDDTTPTLTRLVLRDGVLVQEDLMAGVEKFEVTYGIDTTPTDNNPVATSFVNAAAVTAANNWDNVSEVRFSLVLRNSERDPTYTDTKPYVLYGGGALGAGVSYTPPSNANPLLNAQKFLRKVFNSTVQVRNINLARIP